MLPPHPRYYDPIRGSRRLPRISQWGWLYRGAAPDDAVWAASEIVLTLSHPPFSACRYPDAGGNEGTMSRSTPHHWPSPRKVGLGSLICPAPGFVAGPCFDASVFASRCGPPSGSPLDQVPPLSGRQRLLRPSFPRPGRPETRSDMTTQPTGLVLRWDSHPLGECCCELQLPSTGVTRRQWYYGPLRHPRPPGRSLAGVRLRVTRPHGLGLPVLRRISFQACRRHYPGGITGFRRCAGGRPPIPQ